MQGSTNKIKNQIRKLAKDFGLKYDTTWFDLMWIPTRAEILSEYIGGCPDPLYAKYGKTPSQKIANITRFVNSKDFKSCLKRYGGQAASKSGIIQEVKFTKKIKDKWLKEEMLEFYKKLALKLSKASHVALLTIPKNKKEKSWLMKFILRHEWIHILLQKNEVHFQDIKKSYWVYDEGINEYMGAYLDNTLPKLEKFRDKEKYPLEKQNWIYALKFRTLFENCKTPKERKRALIKLLKSLK